MGGHSGPKFDPNFNRVERGETCKNGRITITKTSVGNILRVPEGRIKFGVESLSRLEYDTEQQVLGNHLLCAWETLEETRESSRKAHTRSSV